MKSYSALSLSIMPKMTVWYTQSGFFMQMNLRSSLSLSPPLSSQTMTQTSDAGTLGGHSSRRCSS